MRAEAAQFPVDRPVEVEPALRGRTPVLISARADTVRLPTSTWRLDQPGRPSLFCKIAPRLGDEAERMTWASTRVPSPSVVAFASTETVDWMVTTAVAGVVACERDLLPDVGRVAAVLGESLRLWHELPVSECPFDVSTEAMLDGLESYARQDHVTELFDGFASRMRPALDVVEALRTRAPAMDRPAVLHGDYGLPNVLVTESYQLGGFIDLDGCGVGDPWLDLAACLGSLERPSNRAASSWRTFLRAYGTEPDVDRIVFWSHWTGMLQQFANRSHWSEPRRGSVS